MNWIDEQLGKISMYRLVLYSLCALIAMSLLLMIVGTIPYSPVHFVVSVIVLIAAAYASNRLFGWLFGVHPYADSSLITALIIALVFTPATTLEGFLKLALVAVIAMASKYILVIRGRHIFNPAAIAVVIASISGLAYASWWVATPSLIPITLLAGFLILRRVKKQFISLAFIGVAAVSLLLQGNDLTTIFVSWPLLFVGAVMLTEPLTLPPKAYQQYIVAVAVGMLITFPVHYGRITMTPALALTIGNVIGWWYGQRKSITLRYVGVKRMKGNIYDFTFDASGIEFEPGQYIEISLPHKNADSRGSRRVFSIVASPGDEQINVGTKIPEKPSSFKRSLLGLKPGTKVQATRIAGDFVLPKDDTAQTICIAGGIGITPFISFITSSKRPLKLYYVVSRSSDISYVDQLRHYDADVTLISQDGSDRPVSSWEYIKGKLDKSVLDTIISQISKQSHIYISGPPAMVLATRDYLKKNGLHNVKVDEFSGY
jgi:glycine betaine catabolism B